MREYEDRDGNNKLIIRVEQKDNVVHFCEWMLPDKTCFKAFGFSRLDLTKIKNYLTVNESSNLDYLAGTHSLPYLKDEPGKELEHVLGFLASFGVVPDWEEETN